MQILYLFGVPWWSCPSFRSNVALRHKEGVLSIICAVAGSDAIKWFRSSSHDVVCPATHVLKVLSKMQCDIKRYSLPFFVVVPCF